jgi:hypothetical protein
MGEAAHVPVHFGFSSDWETPVELAATRSTAVEANTSQCLDMDRQTSEGEEFKMQTEVYHADSLARALLPRV